MITRIFGSGASTSAKQALARLTTAYMMDWSFDDGTWLVEIYGTDGRRMIDVRGAGAMNDERLRAAILDGSPTVQIVVWPGSDGLIDAMMTAAKG